VWDFSYNRNYFDGIISTLVVEHGLRKQIVKWCEDMKNILKPGGILAFAVPSIKDPRASSGYEIEKNTRMNTNQIDGDIPHHFFTNQEIESLFRGYKILYKKLQSRPSATADVTAEHWEYLFQKV
jgi:predicted SAM-dependent methyltransferase